MDKPKPWYDGMTDEQIREALENGTVPGSFTPGAVIEVPRGFLSRHWPPPTTPGNVYLKEGDRPVRGFDLTIPGEELRSHGLPMVDDAWIRDWMDRLIESCRAPLREAIARGLETRARAVDPADHGAAYTSTALLDAAARVRTREWEAQIPSPAPSPAPKPKNG